MNIGRSWCGSLLLPNGMIMVLGGATVSKYHSNEVWKSVCPAGFYCANGVGDLVQQAIILKRAVQTGPTKSPSYSEARWRGFNQSSYGGVGTPRLQQI
jgi:hypothetical protein